MTDGLLGEIAYVRDGDGCVKHPIIFTKDGWKFCSQPSEINPQLIERDAVCIKASRSEKERAAASRALAYTKELIAAGKFYL